MIGPVIHHRDYAPAGGSTQTWSEALFLRTFCVRKTKYFNEIRRNNSKQSQYYVKCTENEKNMKKKIFKIIDFL